MVDLPTIKNSVPTVTAPTPMVSRQDIAQPYQDAATSLAQAARATEAVGDLAGRVTSQIGDMLSEDVAKPLAVKAGLKAVTRDADGNVQVDRLPIVGDAAVSFQRAVETAAVADGEAQAKRDLVDLQEKHRDDPEGFRHASQAYRESVVEKYEAAAGPAVGMAIGRTIDNASIETYRGLLNRKEAQELRRATSSIEAQIDTLKNEAFALANGGDTSSPEYVSRLQRIGSLYGSLAGNPRLGISRDRVEYELTNLKSELAVASLDYRLQQIQKEQGVDAAVTEAGKIKTDPGLNLTPGQRVNFYSRLLGGIQQRANIQAANDKGVANEINSVGELAAKGFAVPPERMAKVREAVSASGNPDLDRSFKAVETALPTIQSWQKMSPAQLERSIVDLEGEMRANGASEAGVAIRDLGMKLLKDMRDGIKNDPLGWSDHTGAMKVPPIDFAAPDAAAQMRARAAAAETVAAHYGVAPTYLRPEEKLALQAISNKGGAPMLNVASTIVSGFGDRAQRVLTELSTQSPALAQIGSLINGGGSPAFIRDAAEAIALQQNPEFKHPTWLGKDSDTIQSAQQARVVDVYGNAFFLEPETGRAAQQLAKDAFFTRSARNGYDPKLEGIAWSQSKAQFDRSLQEAAGATYDARGMQYGGIADYGTKPGTWFTANKVLVPPNIRADRFKDVIAAVRGPELVRAIDVRGQPYRPRDIQNATPVAVRGGYQFAQGDPTSDDPKWIRGADGRPFVLDLDRLGPALRQRVPGAYVGQ